MAEIRHGDVAFSHAGLRLGTNPLNAYDPAPAQTRRRPGRRRRQLETNKAIPVPEPSCWLLLGAGLGFLVVLYRVRGRLRSLRSSGHHVLHG